MSHSFNKIWIHAIWSTKNRLPLIRPRIETKIYQILNSELREAGCPVKIINGMQDHVHCLFLLNSQKSIAEVIKQIKGTSSHIINQNNLTPDKFSWQCGYAAYSVSASTLPKIAFYIQNQKKHHQSKTFEREWDEILKLTESPSLRSVSPPQETKRRT